MTCPATSWVCFQVWSEAEHFRLATSGEEAAVPTRMGTGFFGAFPLFGDSLSRLGLERQDWGFPDPCRSKLKVLIEHKRAWQALPT